MRRNTINSTSGFKMDLKFGFPVLKNLYTPEIVLKMQFKGLISRVYTFLGTGNRYVRSILKPEVELMVFLRMRSNKSTKNAEKCPYNTV